MQLGRAQRTDRRAKEESEGEQTGDPEVDISGFVVAECGQEPDGRQ